MLLWADCVERFSEIHFDPDCSLNCLTATLCLLKPGRKMEIFGWFFHEMMLIIRYVENRYHQNSIGSSPQGEHHFYRGYSQGGYSWAESVVTWSTSTSPDTGFFFHNATSISLPKPWPGFTKHGVDHFLSDLLMFPRWLRMFVTTSGTRNGLSAG